MGYFTHVIEPARNEVSINGINVTLDCSAISEYELVIKDKGQIWGETEPFTGRDYSVSSEVVEGLFSEAEEIISSMLEETS